GIQLYRYLNLRVPGDDPDGGYPGDELTLVTTSAKEWKESGQLRDEHKREQTFEVVGVFETGIFDQDRHQMMCAIDDAQAFLKIGAAVTGLNMKVTDFNRAKE